MIKLENVSFLYGDHLVLKNISFSIQSGEIVALIGISGSGKTTLFRLMTGVEQATSGTLEGVDSSIISYMQQEDLLLPWRTVLGNLTLIDELGKKPRDPAIVERALRLLKLVGLEGRETSYPHQLSGGMRQRVSLVRALLQNRPILFLDEPFGPLDVIVREELYTLLRNIRDDYKKTIVMVTHDFRDALALADRILVLSNGEITQDLQVKPGQEEMLIQTIRSSLCALGNCL